ncbi:adrenodoxin-like protein- mitochondrial precursor [Apiospora marii]|uniref:Adrenodoxin-like protein- mitochondrial n=1 Tax=Apiospora marii TaxID=335849 RepID=A0ABR1R7V5_9PEZI
MAATSRSFAPALRCLNAPSKLIASSELSSRSLFSSRSRLPSPHTVPRIQHNAASTPRPHNAPQARLHVTFIDKDNSEHTLEVSAGDNLLDIAQANDLEMEGAWAAAAPAAPAMSS